MSVKTRVFKCTGCGDDKPCTLKINQEPYNHGLTDNDLLTEDLKCVLDSTNQTSYAWEEVFKDET